MKKLDTLKTIFNALIIVAILLTIGLANLAMVSDGFDGVVGEISNESSGCGPPPITYDSKGNRVMSSGCGSSRTFDKDGNEIRYDDKGNAYIVEHGAIDPDTKEGKPAFFEDTEKPGSAPEQTPQQSGGLNIDPSKLGGDEDQVNTQGGGNTPGGGGGSCPYIYTWNGSDFFFDNDIMPFKGPAAERTDYYRIQKPLVPEDGYYKLRIAEELPETSYLDSVRLITVDHPSNIDVYPDLEGNIFNISSPQPLLSCVDNNGNDRLSLLQGREELYAPGTFYEGNRGDYVIANFGDLSGNDTIKLVITSDGPPESEIPLPEQYRSLKNIYIESLVNRDGITKWEIHCVFSPHELWATNVFDISSILPDVNGDYRLRFFFSNTHKIDFIGIDTSPEVDKEIHELAPVSARAGEDVLTKVAEIDGNYMVMKKGDELFITFPYQPASDRSNFTRNFVFVSRGYYIPDQK